jgi:hypothetical protein
MRNVHSCTECTTNKLIKTTKSTAPELQGLQSHSQYPVLYKHLSTFGTVDSIISNPQSYLLLLKSSIDILNTGAYDESGLRDIDYHPSININSQLEDILAFPYPLNSTASAAVQECCGKRLPSLYTITTVSILRCERESDC